MDRLRSEGRASRRASASRAARLFLLGGMLLLPIASSAEEHAEPEHREPAPAAAPDLAEIARGAEQVEARLRHLRESLADTSAADALERDVAALSHRTTEQWNATTELLKAKPRRLPLDSSASSWEALRDSLEEADGHVEARAKRREADLVRLAQMRDAWTKSLELARAESAPDTVLDRVQATLTDIDAMSPLIVRRRAHLLTLEDSLSRSMQASDDALERIAEARRDAVARIAAAREPVVWDLDRWSAGSYWDASSAAPYARAAYDSLRLYFDEHRGGFAITGLIWILLVTLLRRTRAEAASLSERDPFFASAASVLATPFSAAVLLTLVLSRPFRPSPPAPLIRMLLAVGMIAAVGLMRRAGTAALRRASYALVVLFVLDLLSQSLLVAAPAIEQLLSIVGKGAAAILILWLARHVTDANAGLAASRWRGAIRAVLYGLFLGCVASAAAAAVGYVELADFLGGGALFLLCISLVLIAFRLAAGGLLAIALAKPPLARLHAFTRKRHLVERRIGALLDLLAATLWIWLALDRFELLGPTRAFVDHVLEAKLAIGDFELAMGRLIGFFAVVVGAIVATRLVVFLLEEEFYSRKALPRGVPYALSTLTRYGLLLAGFLVALGTLGLDLTKITVLVSAFGIGIGFGFQQIISNFVSGLILLFERPIQVGDAVELGDLGGEVTRIGIRSSTVLTPAGAEVIVPNSKMIEDRVTNWTLTDRRRRIDLEIGVDHAADSETILALLLEVAQQDARVCADPAPEALLSRFRDQSAEFCLRVWTTEPNWMRLRSDLGVAVQRALRDLREGGP